MFSSKKLAILVVLVMIAPLVLTACGGTPEPEIIYETIVETVVVEGETVEKEVTKVVEQTVVEEVTVVETVVEQVEVTAVPEPAERTGSWLDTVIMTEELDQDAAVTRIEAGDLDVYAFNIADPAIAQRIWDSGLGYYTAYGNFNELTFNPAGPEFNDGRLNPFWVPEIREAVNWLIDRDYIVEEILGGLGVRKFVPIGYAAGDQARYADAIAATSLQYANDPEKAAEIITAEMEALGAEMVDGKWTYNGEPVEITGLIRVEDERLDIGDYLSNLLEDLGFTVVRDYKTSAEASPCWLRGEPSEGCFHFYTGGWVSTSISRTDVNNWNYFYTPDGLPFPLYTAMEPTPEFYDISRKLANSEFGSMEERRELTLQAIDMGAKNSQRVWLFDSVGVAPRDPEVTLAADLSGSVYGSRLWAVTLKREGEIGGAVTIGMPSIMTEPWNPVAGSNWVYDMMPIRGLQSGAIVPDPFTGLNVPWRVERAEVFIEEGLPVGISSDWLTLEFVPEIVVPDDAWADWDAENQVWITAGERFTETQTTASKVVMYYEDDYWDKVKWHDGSPVTIGDHVMMMIMQFDPSKEESAIYDPAEVPGFESFMSAFKGWKITSEDPLVIEYYTDAYALDAELNVTNFRAASPNGYYNGQEVGWHAVVPAWQVDANGEAAFSADKAEVNEVEWLSFIAGPTLELQKAQLDAAQAENLIPYEPTLGQYITAEEATARYENLQEWYRRYGHLWVNTGPYFLQRAFPVEGTLILQRNPDFPDPADKWDRWSEAPIPEVLLDGPGSVTIGEEATYDAFITFKDESYPVADMDTVTYLVFDATGNMVEVGDATAVEDGHWQVVLSADLTGALEAGSNQLAVIAVSKLVLLPVTETLQFVTQ